MIHHIRRDGSLRCAPWVGRLLPRVLHLSRRVGDVTCPRCLEGVQSTKSDTLPRPDEREETS